MKTPIKTSLAILVSVAAAPVFAAYNTDPTILEGITGGTFLNFQAAAQFPSGETRNGITITPVVLGANVEYPAGSGTYVNWSLNDSSDATRMIGGRCVEDNNRRTSVSPFVGASYDPFSVTLSGLTPGAIYGLKVVAMGIRPDPVSDPTGVFLDTAKPDYGINDYDFSYGPSAGVMTTFANAAAGTLLYEEISSATVIDTVSYYYYKGAYACNIGDWTADGSGQITLYVGEGAVNTFLNGARTMLDGVVVVPEPSTLALLGLGALALLRRRK